MLRLAGTVFLIVGMAPLAHALDSWPRSLGASAAAAPTLEFGGDSISAWDDTSNPPGSNFSGAYKTSTGASSILGWLDAISEHAFTIDLTRYGYVGSYQGIDHLIALTGGSCPANTAIAITPSGGVSPVSATTNAAGAIPTGIAFMVPSAGQSQGFTTQPGYTFSPTCTTNPTLVAAITGTGTYGSYGDTSAGWLARAQLDACAKPTDFFVNIIDTNDITAGVAEATIVANDQAIIQAEIACGMIPVWVGTLPRNNGTGGWTQTMDKQRIRINRAVAQYIRTQVPPGLGGAPGAYYVDVDHYWTDPTSSLGNPLAAMTNDGLHPNPQGAFFVALAIWEQLRNRVAPGRYQPASIDDVYDATNNPAGNLLLSASGQMSGTGGVANSNCIGTVASGWTLGGPASGSGVGCAGSIESARSDGLPGIRQIVTIADTSGNQDSYTFANYNNYADAAPGDRVYMTAEIDISNAAGVMYVGCNLFENDSSGTAQQASALYGGHSATASPYPTDAQIAKLQAKTLLPDIGLTDIAAASSVANLQAAGSWRFSCRTPPITLQPNVTYPAPNIVAKLTGSSSSVTLKIGNVAIRKLVN